MITQKNRPSVPVVQKQVLADATTSASMTKETGNPSTMMTGKFPFLSNFLKMKQNC
jgi:hypothetical protein